MKFSFEVSLLFLFLLLLPIPKTSAQENSPPIVTLNQESGLLIESADGFMGMKIGMRLQQQLSLITFLESEEAWQTDYLIRRARIQVKGFIFENKLNYHIQLAMDRGKVLLLNAEYKWQPYKQTNISFGQLRPSTGRQFQTYSSVLQMVDRSPVSRFFALGYDLGISGRQKIYLPDFGIELYSSLTHGEGINVSAASGGWAYSGRIDVLPFGDFIKRGDYVESDIFREPKPKLSLGIAYYHNKDAYQRYGNVSWEGQRDDIEALYVDGVFKYQGASLLVEYITRFVENEELSLPDNSTIYSLIAGGEGLSIQGGKFMTKFLESTFSISFLNPNNEGAFSRGTFIEQRKYALGLNNFFLAHNIKIQSQIGYVQQDFLNENPKKFIEFLTQFTISF